MKTLDDYLTDQFLVDRRELDSLVEDIQLVIRTLFGSFVKNKGWPYRIKLGLLEKPKDVSHSTTAMVTVSLLRALGRDDPISTGKETPRFPSPNIKLGQDSEAIASQAVGLLIREISSSPVGTTSKTYGANDPLTLSFVARLLAIEDRRGNNPKWAKVRRYVRDRCSALLKAHRTKTNLSEHRSFFDSDLPTKQGHEVVPNAIIPLRIVQAIRCAPGGTKKDLTRFRPYFETTIWFSAGNQCCAK